jgi:hypothetical protein
MYQVLFKVKKLSFFYTIKIKMQIKNSKFLLQQQLTSLIVRISNKVIINNLIHLYKEQLSKNRIILIQQIVILINSHQIDHLVLITKVGE